MKDLYIDGCSFIYGTGLPRNKILSSLLADAGYNLVDNSREGKSNLAIAMDLQANINDFEYYLIGWTFSCRTYINYNDINLDLFPGRTHVPSYSNSKLDDVHKELIKLHYSVYDASFHNAMSDMLINSSYSQLRMNSKKICFLSWERRDINCPIIYPVILPEERLPDGHLNAKGTNELYQSVQIKLGEENAK